MLQQRSSDMSPLSAGPTGRDDHVPWAQIVQPQRIAGRNVPCLFHTDSATLEQARKQGVILRGGPTGGFIVCVPLQLGDSALDIAAGRRRHHRVLEPYRYTSPDRLLADLTDHVIVPAEAKARNLQRVSLPTR